MPNDLHAPILPGMKPCVKYTITDQNRPADVEVAHLLDLVLDPRRLADREIRLLRMRKGKFWIECPDLEMSVDEEAVCLWCRCGHHLGHKRATCNHASSLLLIVYPVLQVDGGRRQRDLLARRGQRRTLHPRCGLEYPDRARMAQTETAKRQTNPIPEEKMTCRLRSEYSRSCVGAYAVLTRARGNGRVPAVVARGPR